MSARPEVRQFLHEPTSTFSYVVWDPQTRRAAVIDSVLDYAENAGRTGTDSADGIIEFVRREGLEVEWVLETHAHADHLAAGAHIRDRLGGTTGIGEGIRTVQRHFRDVYNLERGFLPDGSQFDHLFADYETFHVGHIEARAIPTPGHTSDSLTYVIGDAAFCGDTLFMPDGGTARCDFPGGSASVLYHSIMRLYELPDETRLFVLHDYRPNGREYRNETTIGEQRGGNIHVRDGVTEAEFVERREGRDRTLDLPRLIIPAVQVNIRAGRLPPAEDNGVAYVKIPIDRPGDFSQSYSGESA
ncbi:Beta-lactamase hydrolase-like protein [wastewater metagenome]|uniref:Beta-lactamase hydrolase-like protein n=2 Tax=unclassified sequences TaxID=12908 RepID=A0A5B8RAW8_9ZZZZ|nr:beta-lactamase hydrolase-like protein [uncultured organism]